MPDNKAMPESVGKAHAAPREDRGHAPANLQEGHLQPTMSGPVGPPPDPIPGVGDVARPAASQPQQPSTPSGDG